MATLERKKKPTTTVKDDETEITTTPITSEEEFNDLTSDPILEDLSKEPMEYTTNETCFLSDEVVQSLQSVKHTCLIVLDLLLLQTVKDLPRNRQRRLSDCSNTFLDNNNSTTGNVLGSITQNTNLLQELSSVTTTTMTRSKSSPPATSISDVHRILDSNHQHHQNNGIRNQDYTLCCSLAALLNDVYRLLELNSSTQQQGQQEVIVTKPEDDVSSLQQQLHDKVSDFQRQRAAGIITIDDASEEMKLIWDEMNHLMNIVSGLAVSHPPKYDDISTSINGNEKEDEAPPAYDSVPHQNVKLEDKKTLLTPSCVNPSHDLDDLLNAIDKLSHIAPRLNNQRVDLSERQVKELAAATLGKTVERLSRGRMEDQRAILPLKTKQEVLQDLIQQIQKSASRSLDTQRLTLSPTQRRDMEFASIHGVINRLDRGRFADQDWISHEEVLINDLTQTTDLLVKSLNRPTYNRQRFSMSAAKERSLFMSGLFNKVENLEGHRLTNQDAEIPDKKLREDEDLNQLLNHIYKSSKPQLDNQRASFT